LAPQERCLSISELNELLNLTLEQSVGVIAFSGELAEVKRAASGHLYCRIQDEESQIDIVLWSSTARSLSFQPTQGLAVTCRGKPNVYRKSGRLQIVVVKMELAGEGELRKKFLELKARLEKEGLFAPERKRALPYLPRAIGVVTSKAGAAIHDILVKLRERMPQIPVVLVDVRVQGPGAAEEIASGISLLNTRSDVDVMIVGRGGGSLEDLWAFNEEVVVRAIFASRIPVISAVGHEVDVSLSDFAADKRAPTPTAAAEMAVPHREELLKALSEFARRLGDYDRWLGPLGQRLDELSERLERRIFSVVEEGGLRLNAAEAHLKALKPLDVIKILQGRVDLLLGRLQRGISLQRVQELQGRVQLASNRLDSAMQRYVATAQHALETKAQKLESMSPKRVLERGYAIVEHPSGIVRTTSQVRVGDPIGIRLSEGKLQASITEVK
jgi:exodeoxyribonuclease VII large subunit